MWLRVQYTLATPPPSGARTDFIQTKVENSSCLSVTTLQFFCLKEWTEWYTYQSNRTILQATYGAIWRHRRVPPRAKLKADLLVLVKLSSCHRYVPLMLFSTGGRCPSSYTMIHASSVYAYALRPHHSPSGHLPPHATSTVIPEEPSQIKVVRKGTVGGWGLNLKGLEKKPLTLTTDSLSLYIEAIQRWKFGPRPAVSRTTTKYVWAALYTKHLAGLYVLAPYFVRMFPIPL